MAKLQRKPKGAYHHPDLERALVEAAIKTIREHGVDSLKLRDVGQQLGVSRTALYRHFEDKNALLARVALEGFSKFRRALQTSVDEARARDAHPIEAMGTAYLKFALENPSHYQTMFTCAFGSAEKYPDLSEEASGAFAVLLNTVTDEQRAGRIGKAIAPLKLAHIIWAGVHGIATLGMAGQFGAEEGRDEQLEELSQLHFRTFMAGLKVASKD